MNVKKDYEPNILYNGGFDEGIHLSVSGDWNPFLTDPIFISSGQRAYVEVSDDFS